MQFRNRRTILLVFLIFLATSATILSTRAGAQDEGWQIVSASYGFRNQRIDVTDLLRDLIARGGVNGRLAVNNQTMGGDPAIGKDKSLHILARNRRNEEHEFDYNEGAFLDVRAFVVRRDDRDERPANYADRDRDRDDPNGLRIMLAYYGVKGRTVNVTDLLRSRVRDGRLNFIVTNGAFGNDPAVGADKVLIVIFRFQGIETATAVREGNMLVLP
jgi:hypothetical protein